MQQVAQIPDRPPRKYGLIGLIALNKGLQNICVSSAMCVLLKLKIKDQRY